MSTDSSSSTAPVNANAQLVPVPATIPQSQQLQQLQQQQPQSQQVQTQLVQQNVSSQPSAQPTPAQQAEFLSSMPLPNPPENVAASAGGSPPKTLWMGDLEPWWDEDYIVSLWKNLNKAVLVKVTKPKKNSILQHIANNGANLFNHSGYCFVQFETYEEAKEALALNGSVVPGSNNKIFRLNWASGATLASQIPQTPEYSIFVGDLSPSTTEAHLLALFQTSFKSVKTVRVMTDPATGSSRCFGFVRFTDEEERRRALMEMNGVWLGGRPIRVALATPKHSNNNNNNNPGYGQQNDFNDRGIDQNHMFLPAPIPPPGGMGYYPPHFSQPSPPQQQLFNDPTNTTVFVGGLANGVPEETLITLFEPFGSIVQVKIPQGKGCGFVKFAKREDAEQAIAGMQGFIIGGSRVRLSWGRSNHNNNMNQQMLLRSQVGMSGGYDGYGVPPPVNSLPQGLPEFAPPPQGIPQMYYAPASQGEPFSGDDSARYMQFANASNGPPAREFQIDDDGIPEDVNPSTTAAPPTL